MFDKLKDKLVRFLSIVGGFSSPEDIARAKRRPSPAAADTKKEDDKAETPRDIGGVK